MPLGLGTRENPFAAERHAPGAIPWLNAQGTRDQPFLDAILDALQEALRSRIARIRPFPAQITGQITGPHGVGKSTLLTHLASRARDRGWIVAQSRPPTLLWPAPHRSNDPRALLRLACIDSADQMPRLRWSLLRARARVDGVVLLVTTHRNLGGINVATLTMDVQLARHILEQIASPAGLRLPSDAELHAMLRRHNASLRHVIFDLYDHYERGWPW